MEKLRGFTLIESLFVIVIIGIISTAIFNMRNVGKDYNDYRKEAVNIIYKEINQSLKDLQRNKVWKDPQGYTHKISSFQISFVSQQTKEQWQNNNTVDDTTIEFTIDGKHYKLEKGILYVYVPSNRTVVGKFTDTNERGYQFYTYCYDNGYKRTDGYDIKDKGLDTSATYTNGGGKTFQLELVKNDNYVKHYELVHYNEGTRNGIEAFEKNDGGGYEFYKFCRDNGYKRTDGYDIKDRGLDTSATYTDGGGKTFQLELVKNDNYVKHYELVFYYGGNRDKLGEFEDIDEAGKKFDEFCRDNGYKRTDGYDIKDRGLDTSATYIKDTDTFKLELIKNDNFTKLYELVYYGQRDKIESFYDENIGGKKFADFCSSKGIKRADGYEIIEKGLDINAVYTDNQTIYQLENIDLNSRKKTNPIAKNYELVYYEGDGNLNEGQYEKVDNQEYKIEDNELRLKNAYGSRTPVTKIDTNPNPAPIPKQNFLINHRYGKDLEIGNIYLYCMDGEGTIIECSSSDGFNSNVKSGAGFYDYVQLIKNRNYTSSKKIKNIDDFEFILSGGYDIEAINLLPDGKIAEGDYISGFKESIYNMNYELPTSILPNTNNIEALRNYCLEARTECKKYANAILDPSCTPRDKMCCRPHITLGFNGGSCNNYNSACCPVNDREESSLLAELRCLNSKRYYELNCDEILATTEYIDDTVDEIRKSYTFTVYAYYKKQKPKCDGGKKQRQPVGQITINTITKTASMALCNNDRETNGIDCGGRLCQNN